MTWVRLDDNLPDHPKIERAGPAAAWLFICGLCYCSRAMTDGFIPHARVRVLHPQRGYKRTAEVLVREQLWERVDGGYQVHDYEDYQPTAVEVKARRRANSERQARSRALREQGPSNAVTNAVTNEPRLARAPTRAGRAGKKGKEDKRGITENDARARGLCDRLAAAILANDPKAKVAPDSERWLTAARLLLDRDGRTVPEVERMIDWCQADEFWRSNILSMSKLREKFTQLTGRAARGQGSVRAKREGTIDWDAQALEERADRELAATRQRLNREEAQF